MSVFFVSVAPESAMTKLRHLFPIPALGAASLLGLLTLASAVQSQTERVWVDPPADLRAPAPMLRPEKANPQPPADASGKAPTETRPPQIENTAVQPLDAASQEAGQTSTPKAEQTPWDGPPSESVAVPRKSKQRAASASRRKEHSTSRAAIRRAQKGRENGQRFRTVQDAVESGLVVMNLRTIELPDGRRITVLVRPDPRTLPGVMQRPYP